MYVGLTLAVWGLFSLDRGLWHDDVQVLFRAFVAPGREGWFPVLASPTRRLLAWPSFLALASGQPALVLELLAGVTWLATGLAAQGLARRLWPDRPWAHVAAAVFTLVATPDGFTNGLVALGYLISILAYLAAVLAGFAWLESGRWRWLVAVASSLSVSFWMADAALLPWALTPLLWACAPRRGSTRSWSVLACLWYGVAIPYLVVLVGAIGSSSSYVSRAMLPIGPVEWLQRWAGLALYNFEPWRWAFARPQWIPPIGSVVPVAYRVAIAAAAGAAVAWRLGVLPAAHDARRNRMAVAAVLLLMSAANAVFAGVAMSDSMVRTHLLSRVFAALLLAGLVSALRDRVTRGRHFAAAAIGLWALLGTYGGLERQDYLAAYWRLHRQELRSILAAAPKLAATAHVVLHVPAQEHYMATEAGYLARAWTTLLYEDPSLECRVFLWSARRPVTSCSVQAGGLECRGERSPDCQRADGQDNEYVPYERLVLLEYSPAENRYLLQRSLPAGSPPGTGYAPDALVTEAAPSDLARALVFRSPGLAERSWPEPVASKGSAAP